MLNRVLPFVSLLPIPITLRVYLIGVLEVFYVLLRRIFIVSGQEKHGFARNGHSQAHKPSVLITGAGGLATAMTNRLRQLNWNVIVASLAPPVPPFTSCNDPPGGPSKAMWIHLDLNDLNAIKPFVDALPKSDYILINCAAVMAHPAPSNPPVDIVVNYLSHYLLTKLLKPSLTINIASSAAFAVSNFQPSPHQRLANYAHSKYAMILWTSHLVKTQEAVAYHPSILPTQLYQYNPLGLGKVFQMDSSALQYLLNWVSTSPSESAEMCIQLLYNRKREYWFTAYNQPWEAPAFSDTQVKELIDWTEDVISPYT
jgi:hypothetical protein